MPPTTTTAYHPWYSPIRWADEALEDPEMRPILLNHYDAVRWWRLNGFAELEDILVNRKGEVIWDRLRAEPTVTEMPVVIRSSEPGLEYDFEATAFRFPDGSWIFPEIADWSMWGITDDEGLDFTEWVRVIPIAE